jgi:hypothetical protein
MKKILIRRPLGLDWRLVRGLGQLHILNRTSLFLVIIVPILAAVWPVVQHTLAWYDGTLTNIQAKLEQISESLEGDQEKRLALAGSKTPNYSPVTTTTAVRDEIQQLTKHIGDLRLRSSSHLPTSWALLFFASLAVLAGRTIFQLGCPDTIREFQLDDYVRERKREYSEAPSVSAVTQAMYHLEQLSIAEDLIAEERKVEQESDFEMLDLQQRIKRANEEYQQLKTQMTTIIDEGDQDLSFKLRNLADEAREWRNDLRRLVESDRGDRGPDFRRRMSLIDLSAAQLYLHEARRARFAMLLCGVCYVIAIVLIGDVFEQQARAVAMAVDWL